MKPEEIDREAETLYAFVRGEVSRSAPGLPVEQADLAARLQATARQIQPEAGFQLALENQLMAQLQGPEAGGSRASRSRTRRFPWASTLAWGVGALLLLLGLSWVLHNLLPKPAPGAGPSLTQAYPYPAPSEATYSPPDPMPAAVPTPFPSPQGNPARPQEPTPVAGPSPVFTLPQMPEVDLSLQAELPDSPAEATLYQQLPWPTLTVEEAQSAAERLGIAGEVYKAPYGPPGSTSLVIGDGFERVFFRAAIPRFQYILAGREGAAAGGNLPEEQAVSAAEQFIQRSGLPAFKYRLEARPDSPDRISLIQTLAGIPLRFHPFGAPQVQVEVDRDGQVIGADADLVNFQALGDYPILSAEQAWQKALSPDGQDGVETFTSLALLPDRKTWQRSYPLDEPVELFGYASSYENLVAGQPSLILFNDDPVSGNIQGLAEAALARRFLQVWGQFQVNAQGQRLLRIDGWQRSAFAMQSLEGVIERQADQAYLVTPDEKLLLPGLPSEVPQGEAVFAEGVRVDDPVPTLEWISLSTGPMGGGGGGGGTGFAQPDLSGPAATPAPVQPTPTSPPVLPQRIEGQQGTPLVFVHQYSDGSTKVEVTMNFVPSDALPGGLFVRLEGPGLAGIEVYHNLPLRVWGVFNGASESQAVPLLNVERVEPVYPGLAVQAWLGLVEQVTLEGQEVLLFTDQDGERFALQSSLQNTGPDLSLLPGALVDPLIVEGYESPDQHFAGYAVLHDYALLPGTGMNDLDGYQMMSASPVVLQESGVAGERLSVVIDQIELVYVTDNLYNAIRAEGDPPVYVQPAWLFSGHYANGSVFELLVQALRPEYLK